MNKWIPVALELPNIGDYVLISTRTGKVYMAHFIRFKSFTDSGEDELVFSCSNYFVYSSNNNREIRAWMPIPEAYTGEWIPTSEKMPRDDIDVTVETSSGEHYRCYHSKKGYWYRITLATRIEDSDVISWNANCGDDDGK